MQKKVKSWRWRITKAGLNQRQFCERFEMSDSQLSEWITGKKTPTDESINKVESHLKTLGV